MTEQEKLDDLHARVTDWGDRYRESGKDFSKLHEDPEFVGLANELYQLPEEELFVLLGKAIMESDMAPEWATELLQDDNDPS